MKPVLLFLVLCLTALLPVPAYAGNCALLTVTTNPVAFGFYNASAISSNGSVNVACTIQLGNTLPSFTVALATGNSSGFTTRYMLPVLGTDQLNYNLYTTASFSTIWGSGTAPSVTQSYSAGSNLSTTSFTAYGNLPANQFVGAGVYGDAITVTVTF